MPKGLVLFQQSAVGITRQISPWDTMVYSTVNPGLMYALVYLMWAPFLYPGAHMPWAIVTVAQMFVIAGLYWLLSVAMPRQGGEYIYISRILHPALGLMSSFMISFTAISWTGVCTDWALKYAVVEFFASMGIVSGQAQWFQWAAALNNIHIRALIGTALIFIIWVVFYKGSRAMMKMSWMALIGTIIGALTFIVAFFITEPGAFATNFTQLTGLNYDDVFNLAFEAGHPQKFLFGATIMAGSTYIILNTLGSTFGANLAGEVRNVQKSQLLAMFGSLAILMGAWAIFYGFSYKSYGALWTNCLMYLAGTGNAAYPFGDYEPFITILIGILTRSPIFIFLIAVAFFMATFGSAAGMSFGPSRNIYAWGFDRLVPEKVSEIDPKSGSPLIASTIALLVAELFLLMDVYLPSWTAYIGYTIFTWFLAWILLGVAGIMFPYRRKLLFESSPPIVRSRFLGLPTVTWLGILTTIISISICIYLLIPFFAGDMPYTMIVMSGILLTLPLIIYYISKSSYAKRGIDIDIQFQEIPAD
ncbi:MAG: APC family permease [Syntrophomonadaceae bacterium]|nr:APC family permease [Syntrophomonadaceae bacterium]MDD3888535.1 APC family permease [Syntrophomonadaceae bacterium]MDD4548622.1 APC family permease [Syntrophomonadaceae bacterium]